MKDQLGGGVLLKNELTVGLRPPEHSCRAVGTRLPVPGLEFYYSRSSAADGDVYGLDGSGLYRLAIVCDGERCRGIKQGVR